MNMRLFAMLGALACAAMTGCVVVGSGGTGGGGGQGQGGSAGNGAGVGGTGGAGGGTGGQGGTGGSAACTTSCGDVLTVDGAKLCDKDDSQPLLDAVVACMCGASCLQECGGSDAACKALSLSSPGMGCSACLQANCTDSINACSSD